MKLTPEDKETRAMTIRGDWRRIWLTAAFVAAAGSVTAQSVISRVPRDYPTIQQALLNAAPGYLILVSAGTYKENLFWPRVDGIQVVAENGPALTTVDGGGLGRVVQFPPGLTRATLLEGFTLTNGNDAEGAGVRIFSSPTLRENRIVKNRCDDTRQNRGGGVFIAGGASPRLERNDIRGNQATGGLEAHGGGVYVASGAGPVLVGNQIVGNLCQGVTRAEGGGVFVDGAAVPVVIGNVIAENTCTSTTASFGGGISVNGGPVSFHNNTVAMNGIDGTGSAAGGGVYFGAGASAGSRLMNNIVALNTKAGGIRVDGMKPALDYNDVWQNTGGNYIGVSPGSNDLSVDPIFAGAGDYHLALKSPLVDAGLHLTEVLREGQDLDGDPRLVDGNFDGLSGNAARLDIGADELSQVRLNRYGIAWGGSNIVLHTEGPSTFQYFLFWSPTTFQGTVQPFGQLLIGPELWFIAAGKPPDRTFVPVPVSPLLTGFTVHTQALLLKSGSGPLTGAFTNRESITFVEPVSGIVENFATTLRLDPVPTTADWTRNSKPGLFATTGYGGNGVDGVLDLSGTVTLDSSKRYPTQPDAPSEWNYRSVHVRPSGTLRLVGPYPIRINVKETCVIEGKVDASGANGRNAPAGSAIQVGQVNGGLGGAGAGAGGSSNTNPSHPIGALPMELRGGPGYPKVTTACGEVNRSENRLISPFEPNCGGGTGGNRGLPLGSLLRSGCSGNGGGHERDGVQTDYFCSNVQANGGYYGERWVITSGTQDVQVPTAGCGGGGGGNAAASTSNTQPQNDIVAGSGGGGGGGVEILCGDSLIVKGTASLLATGGNGGAGYSTVVSSTTVSGGFGGGGAGGSVWLSATSVTVEAGATIDARGGAGNPKPTNPARTGNGGDGYVIARDRGGDPTMNSQNVTPAPVSARTLFDPPGNGFSAGFSLFYDSGLSNPRWAFDSNDRKTGLVLPGGDLIFQAAPTKAQTVHIDFQGAPEVNGKPDPDPAHWYPPGNTSQNPNAVWEPDVEQLRLKGGLRFIRFRIRFNIGKRTEGQPLPNPVAVDLLTIHY